MEIDIKKIKEFIDKYLKDMKIDTDKPIESLGILKIIKNHPKLIEGQFWDVVIKGQDNTCYEKGIFEIRIIFPEEFPKKKPELRFKKKYIISFKY